MPLKVGIVGSHGIVVPHVKAYSQDPLGELVAICDLVRERADSAAEKYGVRAYYSLREMLDEVRNSIGRLYRAWGKPVPVI